MSRLRGPVPVLAFTPEGPTRSQLSLTWGVETFKTSMVEHTDEMVLQVDEPSLPSVLAGRLPTVSGYGHLRAVDPQTTMNGLRDVLAAAPVGTATVVHCCDPGIPLPLLRATGVGARRAVRRRAARG